MATVAGNLFELKQVSGLRLLDIRLPAAFARRPMPARSFGVEGTRRLAGVHGRPADRHDHQAERRASTRRTTAAMVKDLCEAGIDFIKDDELQSDGPTCPFDERVRAVMRVINDHADRTGKKVMYAFNLTGELDQMRRRHDLVRDHGGTCVMASLNSVGLVGHDRARPLLASCRSTPIATAGAISRVIRCSAGPMSPGRNRGVWPAPTTCT